MKKKTLVLIMALASFALAFSDETVKLTILHTNDLHGWMLPFDYLEANSAFMQKEFVDADRAKANAGGLARRASLIKDLRASAKNAVVLIDSGDIFTRGPWHAASYGEPEIEAYNQMGYDMACIGNNEFKGMASDDAQGLLLKLMRESEFPWLCANLTVGGTEVPVEGVRPFIVRRFGNLRIGFLGLTSARSRSYAQTIGWTFTDPVIAATYWVPIARKECDVLIAVTHIGLPEDRELAAKVEGIDAIIGGDSHTFIPEPIKVNNPKGVPVPIAQDGAYGVCLGILDLAFTKGVAWSLKDSSGRLIPIDEKTAEEKSIKDILERWGVKPSVASGPGR